jgi:FkbM family methyltransferase
MLGGPVKVTALGRQFYVDMRDDVFSNTLFLEGIWEPEETAFIRHFLRSGMTFVDIGANLGYYTVLASENVGLSGRVFAFEPDRRNFKLLNKNVSLNQCHNVTVENKAISDRPQEIQLYRSPSNFGDHRIYAVRTHESSAQENHRSRVSVSATSLDDYFREMPARIDFVKMDVQGAEYAALLGMKRLLTVNQQVVLMTEYWPSGLSQAGASPSHFLNEARQLGFRLFQLTKAIPKEMTPDEILNEVHEESYVTLILSRNDIT